MLPLSLIGFGIGINHFIHLAAFSKRIALTFDDGPYGTSTAQILSILEREHVLATFFLIGKNVVQHPDQVRREVIDGDVIGNHSYSHSRLLPVMATSTLHDDISQAQSVIMQATSLQPDTLHIPQLFRIPHLFRPPYSSTSPGMIKEIKSEGYVFAGWSIDPKDWDNNNSSGTVVSNVLNYAKPDGIIIMHDGHEYGTDYSRENTIEALPIIIESLKKEGYQFVTIDKILGVKP